MAKKNVDIGKLVGLLTGDKKIKQIANVIDRVQIKESEQIRKIVPIEEWCYDDYYIGHEGNTKLYPFWKDLICDIFGKGKQNYTTVVLTGGIGCRPINDTLYETSEGLLHLNEIQNLLNKNIEIYINTESGVEQIIATHIIGEKEIITLTLSDGTVFTGSSDHLLKVFDGNSIIFKKLSDITENDQILKSNCKKSSFNKNDYSENEAYFTGSILGDGSITTYGHIDLIWDEFLDGTNEIEAIVKSILPDANIHHRVSKNNWHYKRLRVQNKNLFNRLFGVDCCYNSHNKVIPNWVFCASDKVKWQFIAGLFDTDGCISCRGDITIDLVSEKLITQLKWLLSSLGVSSIKSIKNKKYKDKPIKVYGLYINNIRSKRAFKENCQLKWKYKFDRLQNVNISYNKNCRTTLPYLAKYMQKLPHIIIPRTLDSLKVFRRNNQDITYETLMKYKTYYSNWFYSSDVLTYIDDHECSFISITNKSVSNAIVGDIEVAGSHTYISDGGLINHNTGKSTCGLYILLRKLYELSCYKNVAGLFGMMSNSFTAFLYFSLTKFQAERTGYAQFRSIIDGIPYFNELFCRNKYRNSTLDFPENVRIFYGSSAGDMIGMNVIASILDEANFFGDSSGSDVDYGSVVKLHDSIMSRQSSRYTKNGVNHSLSIVISSSTFQSSYTQQLSVKSLTDGSIKYARARLWDVKPKGTYSEDTFYVFAGNDKIDPFIIPDTSTLGVKLNISLDPALSIKEAVSKLSHEFRILIDEVPIDFYPNYKDNVIQGLQDFSGMSVSSTGKLFSSHTVFEACIDESKPLFSKNEFTIETMNDDPSNCIQYYLANNEFPHKECSRYIHIDIGVSNDAYGIACCYKYGSSIVDGVETPIFHYDFALRIAPPPPPKRVSISRCHEFIKYMRDNLGLKIGLVTFDQFQSMASRQYLEENGFNVAYQSVDKTDEQYLFFVDCLYKNCVHFNRDFADSIHKELFELIWYRSKRKVDHPSGGTAAGHTKDIMDAVVGSLYNAKMTKEAFYNPEDLLCLSKYNLSSNNYSEQDIYEDSGFSEIAPNMIIKSADSLGDIKFEFDGFDEFDS